MNRSIKTVVLAVVIMFGASFMPAKLSHKAVSSSPRALTNYIWYKDIEMTDPTGTYSDVAAEISRLQGMFGSYIFSSTPSMNLHEYEWGYDTYSYAIIYSDR